jgi:hypothetical protein
LSYAEIKALCAGNPRIAEKMSLDNEVARLRLLKSEHRSQRYRLEDDLLKRFPEQTAAAAERAAGIEKDIAAYAAEKEKRAGGQAGEAGAAPAPAKFPGMEVGGVAYAEKEPAAKALLGACAGIKSANADARAGEYMGFGLSLRYDGYSQQICLLMRGAMTYQIELGTDALGNIARINNALDRLPERLGGARETLAEIGRQAEAARAELEKPFEQEAELQEKEARLALLNADLNIDGGGGMDAPGDAESGAELDGDSGGRGDVGEPGGEGDGGEPGGLPAQSRRQLSYGPERAPLAATAKARPSILDGIRGFGGGGRGGAAGGGARGDER